MKISSRTHGILDYIVSIALILAPRIFNLDMASAEGKVPLYLGITSLVYSLLTRYELGAIKVLPFRVHLVLDVMSGLLLALSPWIFSFSDRTWAPHLIVGALEIAVVALTRHATASVTSARS
jgi:hypothetical protein